MKTLLAMTLVAGMTMGVYGQALLTDITTYEASVIDEASGQSLASAGPWAWQDLTAQELIGDIAGSPRTIVVKCRNAAGQTIFGGTLQGLDLAAFGVFDPMNPFGPPAISGPVSLMFVPDNYTVAVFLNGQAYIGEMLMLPAADDPVGPVIQTVAIDIKPGSVKNPFNVRSEGRLPVAILGSAELDVSLIDPTSIKLATIAPVRFAVSDIQADGYADLLVYFRDPDVVSLLPGAVDGEIVGLELTGTLENGTLITGTDIITVQVKKAEKKDQKDSCKRDNDQDKQTSRK